MTARAAAESKKVLARLKADAKAAERVAAAPATPVSPRFVGPVGLDDAGRPFPEGDKPRARKGAARPRG